MQVQYLLDLIIIITFGPSVPLLLVLAPIVLYTQWAALRWEKLHAELSFGKLLAADVLVQQPNLSFQRMAGTSLWLTSSFLMWDMEFDWGPLILGMCTYPVLAAFTSDRVQVVIARDTWHCYNRGSQQEPTEHGTTEVGIDVVEFQLQSNQAHDFIHFRDD